MTIQKEIIWASDNRIPAHLRSYPTPAMAAYVELILGGKLACFDDKMPRYRQFINYIQQHVQTRLKKCPDLNAHDVLLDHIYCVSLFTPA